jgi:hypothetical protein
MKLFHIFIILILSVCFIVVSADNTFAAKTGNSDILGGRKPKTDSDRTILEIEEIVVSLSDKKGEVKNEIMQQVEYRFPLDPNIKPEKLNLSEITKKADLEAEKKYPFTREELKNKYSLQADKKFKTERINSKVTIEYRQGPYLHKVTGIFHGFTYGHDGIRIGRTVIPLIDLLPKDKIRFDQKYLLQEKKNYVKKCITKELSNREEYAIKQIKSAVNAISKKNEKAGYIYAWQKWRTPREVAKIIIKHHGSNK